MVLNILLILVSLAMILYGANWLTDGGSTVAKRFGISELVIGLTVVAFGTSTPELVISVVSAMKGSGGLAIGNVVGSNIFNVLLIVGVVALIRPIKVDRDNMTTELPLTVLASVALLVCANGHLLDGDGSDGLSRVDGLLLLLFFVIFMRHTFNIARRGDDNAPASSAVAVSGKELALGVGKILAGLAGLIWGGDIFVDKASALASVLGVSDAVIGLTVVAVGTSLPELATSVVAAVKGQSGLAIGNVVGSCIFNIFLVLGASATIHPLTMGGIGNFELLTMTGSAVLFWLFGWIIKTRTITRGEGAVMVACFIAYTAVLIMRA